MLASASLAPFLEFRKDCLTVDELALIGLFGAPSDLLSQFRERELVCFKEAKALSYNFTIGLVAT